MLNAMDNRRRKPIILIFIIPFCSKGILGYALLTNVGRSTLHKVAFEATESDALLKFTVE